MNTNSGWEVCYQAAVFELDDANLRVKIDETRRAIDQRLLQARFEGFCFSYPSGRQGDIQRRNLRVPQRPRVYAYRRPENSIAKIGFTKHTWPSKARTFFNVAVLAPSSCVAAGFQRP
jgi:hypothetical protein